MAEEPVDVKPDARRHAIAHLRRYPKWYAAAAVWLLAMLALPVIELDPLQIFNTGLAPAQEAAPASTAPSEALPIDTATAAGTNAPSAGGVDPSDPSRLPPTPPPELLPPEEVPPDMIDQFLDMIPPPQALPEIPAELQAVVRAAAPLATQACTGLGLASLVVAVVAPSAEGVPLERLLPYLAPVTSACANFPIPEQHTVCAADEPLIFDLGGVATSPPVLGLGIDQLQAIEDIINASAGTQAFTFSEYAREVLDCQLVD